MEINLYLLNTNLDRMRVTGNYIIAVVHSSTANSGFTQPANVANGKASQVSVHGKPVGQLVVV